MVCLSKQAGASLPDSHRPTGGRQHQTTEAMLNSIAPHIANLWNEDSYAEWINEIQTRYGHSLQESEAEDRKGTNAWTGHNMWEKSTNAGLRLITTNVAKKAPTVIDSSPTGEHIRYIDMVIEYMKEMEGDITIIHEPGTIQNLEGVIAKAAEDTQYQAIVAPSQRSKAAGAIIILNSKWRKVLLKHSIYYDAKGEARAVSMQFKAKHKMKNQRKDRMPIQAVYGYNDPTSNANRQASQDMWQHLLKKKEPSKVSSLPRQPS